MTHHFGGAWSKLGQPSRRRGSQPAALPKTCNKVLRDSEKCHRVPCTCRQNPSPSREYDGYRHRFLPQKMAALCIPLQKFLKAGNSSGLQGKKFSNGQEVL